MWSRLDRFLFTFFENTVQSYNHYSTSTCFVSVHVGIKCAPHYLGKSHNFRASLIANNLAFFSTEELSYLTELDTEDYGKDGSAAHKGKGLSGLKNHNLLRSIEGIDLYYDEEESTPRISRGHYDEEESKPRISRGQGALENLLCSEPNSQSEETSNYILPTEN